jgi:nucleoside diphosphate kinase
LDFYGPVEAVLKKNLASSFGKQAQELLEKEFGFGMSAQTIQFLNESFGIDCARDQFLKIVEFMSGKQPGNIVQEEPKKTGDTKCMILIYEGENAINKIRKVLGPTDPLKAPEGTVRREFGSSIMVNTAHASDSRESYEREKDIVRIYENSLVSIIREHLG